MAASTVTGNTSVVLVSSIGTKVYLSSVAYPGHIVTIRDYNGVASQGTPIVVSTTKDIFFADGSISTFLYNPYSFLTVSSKTPTTWQILNNVGYLTTLSNAYVENLTTGNAYVTLVSSVKEFVSTSVIGNVNVTKSLNLLGDVVILGDITIDGEVDLFSTLNVRENINLSSALTVGGAVRFTSSLDVAGSLTVYGIVSTVNDLVVDGDLSISSALFTSQIKLTPFVDVQTLKMDTLIVGGGIETAGGISVGSNLFVGNNLTGLSTGLVYSSIQALQSTFILGDTMLQKKLTTSSLQVFSSANITQEVSASSLTVYGRVSTADSLYLTSSLVAGQRILVSSAIIDGNITILNNLTVDGDASISTILVGGNLTTGISSWSRLFSTLVTTNLTGDRGDVLGNFIATGSTEIGYFFAPRLSTLQQLSTGGNLGYPTVPMSSLNVGGDTAIGGNLIVNSSTLHLGTFSTTNMQVGIPLQIAQDMTVLGNLFVNGPVTTSNIIAPIPIRVSTVTLSNIMTASNANIPILLGQSTFTTSSLMELLVGTGVQRYILSPLSYVNVNGNVNIRGELNTNEPADGSTFRKTVSTIRTSTLQLGTVTQGPTVGYVSSFVVGSNSYLNPTTDQEGYFLFGTNMYKLQLGLGPSFNVYTYSSPYSGFNFANSAAYRGGSSPLWVVVGNDSTQLNTIQYSLDGVGWSPILTGGFKSPFGIGAGTVNDVIYMSTSTAGPLWLATGVGATGAPSIQLSYDGSNWTGAVGSIFPTGLGNGRRLFYFPDATNPSLGVALAGGFMSPSPFGILFSDNGLSWTQATGAGQFDCYDITIGIVSGGSNLVAVGYDSSTFPGTAKMFKTGLTGFASWTLQSNTPPLPMAGQQYTSIAYGNNVFVLGTSATGTNSLYYSPNLGVWNTAFSGGFSGGTKRVVFNSNYNVFIAVGQGSGGLNIQTSPDGVAWTAVSYPFTDLALSNLVLGEIPFPDYQSPYFTANVESRFQTAVSSLSLQASTIRASSISARYFSGNATGLSSISKFGADLSVSSITTRITAVNSTFYNFYSTTTLHLEVSSSASLFPTTFLSTVNIWLATGLDALSNGSIQATQNVINWTRASNVSFDQYGSAIWGNGLAGSPLFVATGADSSPSRTIQYSRDGYNWTPANTGGFTSLDVDGNYSGTTVAYGTFFNGSQFYNRWLVGGNNSGTTSTIFYSDDGSNFYPAQTTTDSVLSNSVQVIKTGNLVAAGLNSNLVIRSEDGINWDFGFALLDSLGYGYIPGYGFGWLGLRANYLGETVLNYSSDAEFWTPISSNSFIQSIRDMFYTTNDVNGYWIFMASNTLYLTSTPTNSLTWAAVGNFVGGGLTQFESLFYNRTLGRWFAGGEAEQNIKTLWTSPDGITWSNITSGGFSTQTASIGAGYSVIRTSSMTLAGGTGSFTARTEIKPQIYQVVGIPFSPSIFTSTLLTQSNTSNVFSTSVYGLAFTSSPQQTYPYVAVGDGLVPQKTIARSSNLSEWVPAVTGGFSPAGYGALYYSTPNLWIGVGDSIASTATIQYSPDSANWFATNNSGSITTGGRAVAKFRNDHPNYPNRLVAVGRSPLDTSGRNRTIGYSDNGTTWIESAQFGGGFVEAGYGLGAGYHTHPFFGRRNGMIGVGTPYQITSNTKTYSLVNSIQYTTDGDSWNPATTGGFEIAGYGVAYGLYFGQDRWVAVGENSNYGLGDTIKYSGNGLNWSNANSGTFYYAGYGVTYYPESNVFIAVGKTLSNTNTIIYSFNGGIDWSSLNSNTSGFNSQRLFGTTYGLFSQELITLEQNEFLNFPKAIVYSRSNALAYPVPTVRLLSTATLFNEVLSVNLSSQVMINTFTPVGSNTVTVNGDIQASQFIYKGTEPTYANLYVSSIQTSTLQFISILRAIEVTTPSLHIGSTITRTANRITTANDLTTNTQCLNINDTLFSENPFLPRIPGWIGINISSPTVQLDVKGTVACSTLSTVIYKESTIRLLKANSEYIQNPNLSIFEGPNPYFVTSKNTVYSEASTITFNSILSVNLSTQKVGVYTKNPLFDLDVRTAGWFNQISTPKLVTGTLFLTLQSL
jgi:cytoskeletal protein CcmA (bactofilin family)